MECVWDDGSYDAADDPDTGSADKCGAMGGTWEDPDWFETIEGTQYGAWRRSASSQIQFDMLTASANVNAGSSNFSTDQANFSSWQSVPLPTELDYGPNDPARLAPNNGRTNWPPTDFKPLFCTGDALAAKGASIALDAVGTVPGLNDAVGLSTGIVGAGVAAADREDPGIGAASAGAGLALTTGYMAGVAMFDAKMVPVVGNVISGLTGLYDIYGAYKAYQNCIASSKYD